MRYTEGVSNLSEGDAAFGHRSNDGELASGFRRHATISTHVRALGWLGVINDPRVHVEKRALAIGGQLAQAIWGELRSHITSAAATCDDERGVGLDQQRLCVSHGLALSNLCASAMQIAEVRIES